MTSATCKKCGATGLVWRRSVKGHFYLANQMVWRGDMGGIKTLFPAHVCGIEFERETDSDEKNSRIFDGGFTGVI